MKKKPTMQQIANALNVTPITVSRALNDREGVSEELKEKIKQYAYETGYLTKETTKKNTQSRPVNIILLVAEVFIKTDNKFYIDFYKKILDSLEENSAFGILKIIEEQEVEELAIPKLLLGDNIDGMIVLGELPSEYINELAKLNLPTILLDFYDEDLLLDAVVNDNFFEAYEMTRYLISKGHKDIAFVGNIKSTHSIQDRYLGYHKALLRSGITINKYEMTRYLISKGHKDIAFVGNIKSTHSIQDRYLGYHKALLRSGITINKNFIISDRTRNGSYEELILPSPLPTAFVCNCDQIAFQLVQDLRSKGIQIPEDCSIASFDNSKFSTSCTPQLTTMDPNLDDMVKACVSNILKKVSQPNLKTGLIAVKGALIERESVREI